MGVDFWWIDWQQGDKTKMPGLDPLFWLNHLHFYDLARDGKRRPSSSPAGAGWATTATPSASPAIPSPPGLRWPSSPISPPPPPMWATAGGATTSAGTRRGMRDGELYARWVQYGVFSPILRLHSTKTFYHDRRPWAYDAEVFNVAQSAHAAALRPDPLPVQHGLAQPQRSPPAGAADVLHPPRRRRSLPRPQPVLVRQRADRRALRHPARPGYPPVLAGRLAARRRLVRLLQRRAPARRALAHLLRRPGRNPGRGPRRRDRARLVPNPAGATPRNPAALDLHLFPGASNAFELYEDDGESEAYRQGHACRTLLAQRWSGDSLEFSIAPAEGETALIPAQRTWRIALHGLARPERVLLRVNGVEQAVPWRYAAQVEELAFDEVSLTPADRLELRIDIRAGSLIGRRDRRADKVRKLLWNFLVSDVNTCQELDNRLPELLAGTLSLELFATRLKGAHLDALRNALK